MPPQVLVCDPLPQPALDALTRSGLHVTYRPSITPQDLLQSAADYDALIVRSRTQITRPILAAAKKLQVIGRPGVGVDNIDLQAAEEAGIPILTTPHALTNAVAELVLGLLIALARSIPHTDTTLKNGEWRKNQLLGTELHGKTLGIIGMGRIGLRVATLAKAFDMTILGHDILPIDPHLLANLDAHLVSLDVLLHAADYVTLHTPLTPQTHHLLNHDTLRRMKPTAFLINTARGRIIDEDALYHALTTGTIRGAALDVFETEPPARHPLLNLPNLIATPHIGSQTAEAQEAAALELATLLQQKLQRDHG